MTVLRALSTPLSVGASRVRARATTASGALTTRLLFLQCRVVCAPYGSRLALMPPWAGQQITLWRWRSSQSLRSPRTFDDPVNVDGVERDVHGRDELVSKRDELEAERAALKAELAGCGMPPSKALMHPAIKSLSSEIQSISSEIQGIDARILKIDDQFSQQVLPKQGRDAEIVRADALTFMLAALDRNLTGTRRDLQPAPGSGEPSGEGWAVIHFARGGAPVKLIGDGSDNYGGALFLRACAVDLLQNLLQDAEMRLRSGRLPSYAIVGTPGIGKSAFGVYVAAVMLAQGRKVYFQLGNEVGLVLAPPQSRSEPSVEALDLTPSRLSWRALLSSRASTNGVYIVDPMDDATCTPCVEAGRMLALLVTSPRSDRWSKWLSRQARSSVPHIYPLPTAEDVFAMNAHCSNEPLPREQVQAVMDIAGPVFRRVLGNTLARVRGEMQDALEKVTPSYSSVLLLDSRTARLQDAEELGNRLVHMTPERDASGAYIFEEKRVQFASPFVRHVAFEKAAAEDVLKQWLALNDPRALPALTQTERGLYFERTALRVLSYPGARVEWFSAGTIASMVGPEPLFVHDETRVYPGATTQALVEGVTSLDVNVMWTSDKSNAHVVDALHRDGAIDFSVSKEKITSILSKLRADDARYLRSLRTVSEHQCTLVGRSRMPFFIVLPNYLFYDAKTTLEKTRAGLLQESLRRLEHACVDLRVARVTLIRAAAFPAPESGQG